MKIKNKKRKIIRSLIIFCFLFFSIISTVHADSIGYVPLAPLPGETADQPRDVIAYVPNIFKLAIGIAGALAVIMITIGGMEYITSETINGKKDGKEKITNAIIGLLLALGSWIILNTIDKDRFTQFDLSTIKPPTGISGTTTPPITVTPPAPEGQCLARVAGVNTSVPCSCSNCVRIGSAGISPYNTIPLKPGANNELNQSLADKLVQLNNNMSGTTWRVTEAWKPTYYHSSPCHINGTCVDASLEPALTNSIFRGSLASMFSVVARVNTFFNAASASGLRAELEVATALEENNLRNAGVTGIIKVVPTITAPHWSVYP